MQNILSNTAYTPILVVYPCYLLCRLRKSHLILFAKVDSANVILIPYVIITSGITVTSLDGIGWTNLLIVGLIHTGVTYCMYFSSLKELPGQKAAILSYIDPLVAVLISVTVLNESMTVWQVIGGIFILGFTLWNEISPKTK